MWVTTNSENHSGFGIAQVVRCHSENGISYSENQCQNSESCSENTGNSAFSLRELLSWNCSGPQASENYMLSSFPEPCLPEDFQGHKIVSEFRKPGTKKEHKPKLLGPDMFRWGGGLPCGSVCASKPGKPNMTQNYYLRKIILK